MTSVEFKAAYQALACELCDTLGLDPSVMLAQWGLETAWGAAVFGNNLANIRCSPTTFCLYATLEDFAAAYIGVMRQSNMAVILTSVGRTVEEQMHALGVSPWDSGHYTTGSNPPGSSLIPYQEELHMATIDQVFNEVRGPDAYANLDLIKARLGLPSPALGSGPGQVEPFWKDPSYPVGGGGVVVPTTITMHIPAVPGDASGKLT